MVKSRDLVVWLKEIDKNDTAYVGGKNANLGEMIQAGFPVPQGFAITAHAYFTFLEENTLDTKIKHLLSTVNYDRPESISQVGQQIKKIISSSPIPENIIREIYGHYSKMGSRFSPELVAIRSSATSEDSKDASFAGQQETYLNVKGEAELMEKVRQAWASLFETRAIFYRHEAHMDHLKTGIALVVQKMIESDASGVMFTIDPVTNHKERVIIESIYGLGEYIVQGRVTPDHYEVDKSTLKVLTKTIQKQTVQLVRAKKGNEEVKVSPRAQEKQKITDGQIETLAKLGIAIEKHYYFPQDIEWAREKDRMYIVQTRPITTTGPKKQVQEKGMTPQKDAQVVLLGDPASPGVGIGPAKILTSPREIGKVQKNDVLIAPYTNPDYVPAMKKASAIITETGGRTSHAAIVSREFGIPAVVGAPLATKKFRDGQIVTVNGSTGEIYKGSILIPQKEQQKEVLHKTATKLYVNLAEPEVAPRVAPRNVDGVGLLRAEFMIAQIGVHPRKLIREKKQKVFIEKLAHGLAQICREFYPRFVLYRATDFKTNEYRNLAGGRDFEPEESNPMLGYRGAFRYIHDPQVFNMELEAIQFVRNNLGLNNLNLMIPFVRTVREMEQVKMLIAKSGLKRGVNFKLYMMVEIPSNAILIEEFIKTGIDGVSIGSNDLTMLVLGTDRDNHEVAPEFDERNEAVLWAYERVIRACNKHGIASGICGQAPSSYPDLVEKLVSWGIHSISVSPDAIDSTRSTIHMVEQKILRGR